MQLISNSSAEFRNSEKTVTTVQKIMGQTDLIGGKQLMGSEINQSV